MIRIFWSLQVCFLIAAFAQPIDARDELILPVNPPKKASPAQRMIPAPKRLPIAPLTPSNTPTALPEKPEFKISKAELKEANAETLELHASISHLSPQKPQLSDIHVICHFYESDQNGNIFEPPSQVTSRWTSPPIDWNESAVEELTLQYSRPAATSGLKYAGCVLGVYFEGQLQDTWATPSSFLTLFPLPAIHQTYRPVKPKAPPSNSNASDRFLAAYQIFQEAERSFQAGNFDEARDTITEALSVLIALQRDSPDWQPPVVEYRINSAKKLLAKIEER